MVNETLECLGTLSKNLGRIENLETRFEGFRQRLQKEGRMEDLEAITAIGNYIAKQESYSRPVPPKKTTGPKTNKPTEAVALFPTNSNQPENLQD